MSSGLPEPWRVKLSVEAGLGTCGCIGFNAASAGNDPGGFASAGIRDKPLSRAVYRTEDTVDAGYVIATRRESLLDGSTGGLRQARLCLSLSTLFSAAVAVLQRGRPRVCV